MRSRSRPATRDNSMMSLLAPQLLTEASMLHPARALLHPAWLLSLAVLGLNDHVLKRLVPSLLTGKLSDFAGLFVAPALLATLLRVRRPRALVLCHVAVALGFAVIKVWPPATLAYQQLSSLILPSRVWT